MLILVVKRRGGRFSLANAKLFAQLSAYVLCYTAHTSQGINDYCPTKILLVATYGRRPQCKLLQIRLHLLHIKPQTRSVMHGTHEAKICRKRTGKHQPK